MPGGRKCCETQRASQSHHNYTTGGLSRWGTLWLVRAEGKKWCQASCCSLNQNTKDWLTCLKKKVLPWEEMMDGKTRYMLARNEDSNICFHDWECSRRMQINPVTMSVSELAAWKEWRARVEERASHSLTYIPFYCEFLNQIDRSNFFCLKKCLQRQYEWIQWAIKSFDKTKSLSYYF